MTMLFVIEYSTQLFAEALCFEFLVIGVGVIGKRIDADAAAGHEPACYLQIFGIHERHQIFHDNIDAVLMKIAVVAEREEVELEALALHHPFARDITNIDMSEIGLSGLRAEGRELRTIEGHEILILGVLVGESLQHPGIVVVAIVNALITQ